MLPARDSPPQAAQRAAAAAAFHTQFVKQVHNLARFFTAVFLAFWALAWRSGDALMVPSYLVLAGLWMLLLYTTK